MNPVFKKVIPIKIKSPGFCDCLSKYSLLTFYLMNPMKNYIWMIIHCALTTLCFVGLNHLGFFFGKNACGLKLSTAVIIIYINVECHFFLCVF